MYPPGAWVFLEANTSVLQLLRCAKFGVKVSLTCPLGVLTRCYPSVKLTSNLFNKHVYSTSYTCLALIPMSLWPLLCLKCCHYLCLTHSDVKHGEMKPQRGSQLHRPVCRHHIMMPLTGSFWVESLTPSLVFSDLCSSPFILWESELFECSSRLVENEQTTRTVCCLFSYPQCSGT